MSNIDQIIAQRRKAKRRLEAYAEFIGTEWTTPTCATFYACVSPSLLYAGRLRVNRFDAIGFMGHRDNLDRAAVIDELLALFGGGVAECAGALDRLALAWPAQECASGASPK